MEPWNSSRKYRFRPDLVLQEYASLENNRNDGTNGAPVFKERRLAVSNGLGSRRPSDGKVL